MKHGIPDPTKDQIVKFAILLLITGVIVILLYFSFSLRNVFVIQGGDPSRNTGTQPSLQPQPPTEEDDAITLVAVGDMMLSRVVEQKMIAAGNWKYPFEKTADITKGADIALGNLETTILPGKVIPSGSFTFRTDPKALEGLEYAGFDVLSLANNHMMNFGLNGLRSTIDNLDSAKISHIGAGTEEGEIYAPTVKEVKGVKFGFLAYSYAREQSFYKDGEMYGTAYADKEKMARDVVQLKKSVDVVVVSMHMGDEYETQPNAKQEEFARAAVDAGAALVIGHHPHVVETFEKYEDGYIIYSLGNFVFDQMWSEETRLGAVAKVTFEGKEIKQVEFVPVKIFDYAQPQPIAGEEADMIEKRLRMENI